MSAQFNSDQRCRSVFCPRVYQLVVIIPARSRLRHRTTRTATSTKTGIVRATVSSATRNDVRPISSSSSTSSLFLSLSLSCRACPMLVIEKLNRQATGAHRLMNQFSLRLGRRRRRAQSKTQCSGSSISSTVKRSRSLTIDLIVVGDNAGHKFIKCRRASA